MHEQLLNIFLQFYKDIQYINAIEAKDMTMTTIMNKMVNGDDCEDADSSDDDDDDAENDDGKDDDDAENYNGNDDDDIISSYPFSIFANISLSSVCSRVSLVEI